MKIIKLSQNKLALVDDEDYNWLNQWPWYVQRNRYIFYAAHYFKNLKTGIFSKMFMHRIILQLEYGDGKQIDHIDGDGLNNQKCNLRLCSTSQNQQNRRMSIGTSSKYKGVCWCKSRGKWIVNIKINKTMIYLGYFYKETDAAIAYNNAASKYYGEFARFNEIMPT